MTDWEAVRKQMLELEKLGDAADVLTTIARILEADPAGLHQALNAELDLVQRLMDVHYVEFAKRSPRNYAAIGFLQGITFARAFELAGDRQSGEPDGR